MAPAIAAELVAAGVDYVVVVRGAIFSIEQTRPDFHQPTGINVALAEAVAKAIDVPVVAAGLDRRRRPGRVGARRLRRPGEVRGRRDDPGPDRRPRPRRQAARRDARADPAVHPVQPDVPGPRRPQPARDVHRRADVGPGDRGPGLVRAGARARRDVTVVGGGPAGLETARVAAHARPPRDARRAARRRSAGSPPSPDRTARSSPGWRPRSPASASPCAPATTDDPGRRLRRAVHRRRARDPRVRRARRRRRPRHRRRPARRRRAARPTATSCCSTRSAARSPSPSPRSSAGGPCSSRRTTSPATSCPAPATSRRPTCAWPRPACASSAAACCAPSAPDGVTLRDKYTGVDRVVPVRRARRLRLPPARRAAPRRRRRGRRLRRPAHRPRGDPRGPPRRAGALTLALTGPTTSVREVGEGGAGGVAGRPSRGHHHRAGSTPSTGRRPGSACATAGGRGPGGSRAGASRTTPPVMSPPMQLALYAASVDDVVTWRASTTSRKPGAKRSIWRLDGRGHVDVRPVRHVAVGPQRVPAGGGPGRVARRGLGGEHERADRVDDHGRRRPRQRRPPRTCRRGGPCRPRPRPDRATAPVRTARSRA